ncbi:acyltransferase [Micromonospora sp. WMMC264]|uniref:acyltransferase n=1 Tax=Micromonospora sp. WMMC264 TaxID=3015158 RepID=UPI0032B1C6DB
MALRQAFYEETLSLLGGRRRFYPLVAIHYPWNVEIGQGVVLNRGTFITAPGAVTIEPDVLIGPYVVINSGDHRFDDPERPVRGQGHAIAPIRIGEGSWLGAHVVVLKGVSIGRGAVVGAGSVVNRSIPDMSIAAGVPARVIGSRLDRRD